MYGALLSKALNVGASAARIVLLVPWDVPGVGSDQPTAVARLLRRGFMPVAVLFNWKLSAPVCARSAASIPSARTSY